ncbi:hypothetical protein, partial [Segatella salivae]|uniref:hypothetical protein n=1 Tax=Segatella salivae TaxID=228604 RepID=UPI00241DE45F
RVLFSFISLAGLPQIPPQKVWSFRALRKSFPKWFGVSAHGESRFPNSLMLAGLPQNSGASGRRQCCEMQDDGTSTHSN